jgi:acyl-CoA thioester hydrolase
MFQTLPHVQPSSPSLISHSANFDTPVIAPEMTIEEQWIDYNDHLNMAYYNVLFDRTGDFAVDILNIGEAYRRATNKTLMTAEAHVSYVRELKKDARVRGTFRLLDADRKRLHVYYELYHSDGWLAATSENMMLHVDLGGPKVTAFADDVYGDIQTMLRYHRSLPKSKYVGRLIGIRR